MATKTDLLILGGGIAGMTAALYARRANLDVTVIEPHICGGLVNSTYVVENFPSYKEIHGMVLMEQVREQIEALGVRVEEACPVTGMALSGPLKTVHTEYESFEAGALIVATGRKPLPLQAEGAEQCSRIHFCAICDGAAYKDKDVLVVGGGNSGFDEALFLVNLGVKSLTLLEAMPHFFAAESAQRALLAHEQATAHCQAAVLSVQCKEDTLQSVTVGLEGGKHVRVLKADGIFVFIGQKPNTDDFKDLLCLDPQGYILTTEDMETNVPGVFAAGDVRPKRYRQITTAMNDGTIAALNAEKYLRSSRSRA